MAQKPVFRELRPFGGLPDIKRCDLPRSGAATGIAFACPAPQNRYQGAGCRHRQDSSFRWSCCSSLQGPSTCFSFRAGMVPTTAVTLTQRNGDWVNRLPHNPATELLARPADGELEPVGQHPAVLGADGPWASQSVVTGRTTVTAALGSGSDVDLPSPLLEISRPSSC